MNWADPFSAWTNLLMCAAVVGFGGFWVREARRIPRNFRYRTYVLWWCSWLAWTLAWLLLTLQAHGKLPHDSLLLNSLVLVLDNLNVTFLILTYFSLSRGDEYDAVKAKTAFRRIALSIAVAVTGAYLGCYFLDHAMGPRLAYWFHNTWSVSLSLLAPILVGWACYLRFNTRVVLVVGFAYGLMQPFVYATQLLSAASPELTPRLLEVKPVIAMILALLKLLWAVSWTRVVSGAPGSGASLVLPAHSKTFHVLSGWRRSIALHAVVLLFLYLVLAITALYKYSREGRFVGEFAVGLGIATSVIAAWAWLWDVYRELTREPESGR